MEIEGTNKKIFITGISAGIGRVLATQLVKSGYEVWGLARRKDLLEKLKQELGPKLTISACDLSDIEEMRNTAKLMREANFIPDVVVLNAAVHQRDVNNGLLFNEAHLTVKTNLDGPLFWISEFLPDFLKKQGGLFVGISSTAAYRPHKGTVSYAATKAALSMAFRGLRVSFIQTGIRFSTVHFGPIATDMWWGKKISLVSSPEDAARFIVSVFEKRSGSYFFPFISTAFMRLTSLLPDSAYVFFASLLKK
ncbi:MAG: hypothetical protein A2831_00570 [Candidatus Yanofskybacteria bacterium RIFCSPHIGHO2_01_FULL_44_17]|uniref:Short-chain dehydrogenase n=1 Tax=Candidatus Yanofskybacteria bacterium RIFCSPHIGHO2_01_FULL_44_17 TaxID=1802668 RepID=A0A1F8EXQ4_9BACT|nr:MAG: hypothetical protein A2831_00570 [Candidatus Yanofskybacteria bacterium RIFCSPHIGHO2_01_FULL_44_17]